MVRVIYSKFLLIRLACCMMALMHDCSKKEKHLSFPCTTGANSRMGWNFGAEHMLPLRVILQDSSHSSSRSSVLDIDKISRIQNVELSTKFQKWEDITDLIFHRKSFITHLSCKSPLAWHDLSLALFG